MFFVLLGLNLIISRKKLSIMRYSHHFIPLIKENPSEAAIVSHRLMLRSGMIRQHAAGIYSWLPLGLRVLRKVEGIIRDEMNRAGAIEVLMPTMQPIELWEESGRGGYGTETLKAIDRHDRTLIYGPTHEEVITDVFRKNVRSYKQLPLNLYQIQWKFRDEIRPRFGVMRGREFLMKDAYTFSEDEASHMTLYDTMYATYFRIFRRMGLKVIPFKADTGLIGGDHSHEFQVVAETGESAIYYDRALEALTAAEMIDIKAIRARYSAADEKHDPATCGVAEGDLVQARGIEVGHIFYFADKYSLAMKAMITNSQGAEVPVMMGAHGIGVSRLLGAIIEAHHDEAGIIWPEAVAPYHVGLVNIRQGDATCDALSEAVYAQLQAAGVEVLYHDTDDRAGAKFAAMDLIGLPWQLIVAPRGAETGNVELKCRRTGEVEVLSVEDAVGRMTNV
jgi:prolyl-tRNA synthetase